MSLPDPTANTAAGIFLDAAAETAADTNAALIQLANESAEPDVAEPETPAATETPTEDESNKPETGKEDATIEGNGDGNGQVPPGQHEDEDGNIVNNGGNMAPGLNRGDKIDKPDNPNKPDKPENPGTEDKDDKKANKANKGTHIYTYDELNRMVSSNIAKEVTNYTYDTLGNLVLETVKNKSVDYEYNELNQLVKKTTSTNDTYTYSYDKRGNRIAETGKKASQSFVYDATNRMGEGTNWKGDKSAYTYNGLGLRVNNLVTTHAGQTYDRDYVIDYTSPENDDLYVYAMGNGQLEYEQRHVYAGSERIEQITEKGNGGWERTLYVHEDVMGNTRYYTKSTGQNFAELQYDAWGQPVSPNKLVNNDHGNYVFATFTGHIYDTTLDIYFAEARFYDATNRTWLAMDPIKDGLNWYQYASSNPTTYWDPTGLAVSYYSELTCSANVTGADFNPIIRTGVGLSAGVMIGMADAIPSISQWLPSFGQLIGSAKDVLVGLAGVGAGAGSAVLAGAVSIPVAGWVALGVGAIAIVGVVIYANIADDETSNTPVSPREKVDDDLGQILEGAEPGRTTKGRTKQWEKSGGFEQAEEDYRNMNPQDSREIETRYGTGYTGVLEDGSKINVRPGSSYGEPTLEIQRPNGSRTKIRYGE